MATSNCIYCAKEFTYLTAEEYSLGQYSDFQVELLKTYISEFAEAGFRYRCQRQEEDRITRDEYLTKIKNIIKETVKEVKDSTAFAKISEYCPHIADYVISLIIKISPGLLLLLSQKTNLDFNELSCDNKNSIGANVLIRFNYTMFFVYCSLGLNYNQGSKYDYGRRNFNVLHNAVLSGNEFLIKYLVSFGITITDEIFKLLHDWPHMRNHFQQIVDMHN